MDGLLDMAIALSKHLNLNDSKVQATLLDQLGFRSQWVDVPRFRQAYNGSTVSAGQFWNGQDDAFKRAVIVSFFKGVK